MPCAARKTISHAIGHLPPPQSAHKLPDHQFIDGARSYPGHTGSEIHKPSKTIKAGAHGVPGGENMLRFPNGTVRYMTVLEAKLIQTFPANYKISGRWGEALRQIGNAVPVKLAEGIGRKIAALLQKEDAAVFQNGAMPPSDVAYPSFDSPPPVGQLAFFEPQSLYLVNTSPVTLLGTYRKTCRDWIVSTNRYNYPVTNDEIKSCRPLLSVRRLVLRRKNDTPLYFKVSGHDIVGKKDLLKLGYKSGGRHPAGQKYILYKLSPLAVAPKYDESAATPIIGKGCSSGRTKRKANS
nr:DNA cytosine methyltransferase [Ereboglobus sp. PH5-10]